jgi:hypothetical protein
MAMGTDSKGEKPIESTQAQHTGAQPKIFWDSSNARSAYANVFNVSGAREEFVLLFGMNQAWDAGQQELKVQLTDRVVMSPFAAKRFATLLNNVIRDYEKRYGAIEIEAPQAR